MNNTSTENKYVYKILSSTKKRENMYGDKRDVLLHCVIRELFPDNYLVVENI